MKRKDFYIEYYNRTNRIFSDNAIWNKKDREKSWRKRQINFSKKERKVYIVLQYLILLLCWIPMCFDRGLWTVIPVALLYFLSSCFITDFSIIKIEILYFIYRQNNVFCSVLHDIFLGNYDNMLRALTRLTKKEATGYVFRSGGRFYGTFDAVSRNKKRNIVLKFKVNSVTVAINEQKFVIKDEMLSKEEVITEIAAVINSN